MPGICLSAIPRPIMKTSRIHPRLGNVCQIFTLSGSEAILSQYLFTIRRNIMKNAARIEAVISSSHQRFSDGCILYALIPLIEIIMPGTPQIRPATKYKCFFSIWYQYFVKLYFCLIPSFSSSERLLKYAFQPGQKLICHLQNLPAKDLGLASCFALKGHVEHL